MSDNQEILRGEGVSIELAALDVINYTLHQNHVESVKSVTIKNDTEKDLSDLVLSITSEPEFSKPFQLHVDFVPAKKSYEIKKINLELNVDFLAGITEKVEGSLTASLFVKNEVIATKKISVSALAFDQWHGYGTHPELLASFVTPNHPAIVPILARAAELLSEWTGDPSFDGYQYKDPDRVNKQAAAIFCALKEQKLIYCVPPASFEQTGQRIRLCDAVLQQKMGTCLDLTLLYVSCLEAIGLNPLLILSSGHIFSGFWLEELTFPESVLDDPSLITKRMAEGVNQINVVETTQVVNGHNATFDMAVDAAVKHFVGTDPIECIIDVRRARLSSITPIPQRVHDDNGWHIEMDLADEGQSIIAPKKMDEALDTDGLDPNQGIPKMVQWERKLLDLSLRNTLINLRFSRTIVPFLAPTLDELENALADGEEFTVLPRPADWTSEQEFGFETMHVLGSETGIVSSEYANHRLRTALTENELQKTVKDLYRKAKTAMEENGANTLFLALGVLRWYESPRSKKPRYAPVILLPVELVRKSANKGYTLRLRDDEPQINITILEKIKQDFGIEVKGLDPLPADESGIDMRMVFTVLRKAVMSQDRWDVLESAYLGIFSFSQFVMWSDLRHRSEDIMKNKIVKSLIDGKLSWDAKAMEVGERVSEDSALLPLPADASQLFAIQAACNGESFVLHGPPGTGKSQTITSLIANALAKGSSVLFVAEKKAALEVVKNRLDSIGLSPFCLELHSNKSKKSYVLDQLRQAVEVVRRKSPLDYARKAEQIKDLRESLDFYAKQLHTPLSCGFTVYELINEYEEYADAKDLVVFSRDFAKEQTRISLEDHVVLLEQLTALGRSFGHPKYNPLSHIGITRYHQQLRVDIPAAVGAYKKVLDDFVPAVLSFAALAGIGDIQNEYELTRAMELAESVAIWKSLPRSWAKTEYNNLYFTSVKKMAAHFFAAASIRKNLLKNWSEDFLSLDSGELVAKYNAVQSKSLVAKIIAQKAFLKELRPLSRNGINTDTLADDIKALRKMQKETAAAEELFDTYGPELGNLYRAEETDWEEVEKASVSAQLSVIRLFDQNGDDRLRGLILSDESFVESAVLALEHLGDFRTAKNICYETLCIENTDGEGWLDKQIEICENTLEYKDSLKEWIAFNEYAQKAVESGLGDLLAAYRGGAEHDDLIPAYKKAILAALTMTAIDEGGALNTFSGVVFNEKLEQYKKIDAELTRLVREEIFCRLASNLPDFTDEAAQSSELGILQKMIKSNGRGTSIRNLFLQLPNLLPRLCPCMLMSPISAAQYLDPKRMPFDIVVFDEASQLPTCKAVGVLARGENAVIVGDPKQMPPTSFFALNTVDEDNLEVEDLESILDDCLALQIPQTHLLWHYRSRHESLISFSNNQFYENKLLTFPSANDRESKVSLIHVDGVFRRGKNRQNLREAEAVVEELRRRSRDDTLSHQSIGVITFNIPQQLLIDDLVSEACKEDPELEKWVYDGEEPLFIKNLENVQGDERDVILFSVGYGPDENGKVYMNFGPLNRDGGWRRLNVAVSRARNEMVVFSSLLPEQINLSQTSAEGVVALRAFLAYADGKELSVDENTGKFLKNTKDGVARRIAAILKENGYETQLQVGHSEYRVDVGVVDPDQPEEYILGILLDGPGYQSSKTTRDREIAQINVLQQLGWNVMRVWTMDWWDNRNKEIGGILEELRRLQEEKKAKKEETPAEPEAPADDFAEPKAPASDSEGTEVPGNTSAETNPADAVEESPASEAEVIVPKRFVTDYVEVELESVPTDRKAILDGEYNFQLTHAFRRLLEGEAPIKRSFLFKRVLNAFGLSEQDEEVVSFLEEILQNLNVTVTGEGDEQVLWNDEVTKETFALVRTRKEKTASYAFETIPLCEIVTALCYCVYKQIAMPRDTLTHEAIRLLGFKRLVGTAAAETAKALEYVFQKGLIAMDETESCTLTEQGKAWATRFE
ncbi:MAG: DUF4011 domain-containing protein [Clostridia bacterium]|nr:DUF4011 domain-containing protein [Clostridia bacterium]